MNSDNCLLSGRTMDYGPFGFLEAYEPLWSPFTSDMERKFGFERQPLAAQLNLMTLARAVLSMFVALDGDQRAAAELQAIVNEEYPALLSAQLGEMRRRKLGLKAWDDATRDGLWERLHGLMEAAKPDYTVFWRQLAACADADLLAAAAEGAEADAARARLAATIAPAFEGDVAAVAGPAEERAAEMRATSPKYVPREWMLAEAYTAAEQGDHAPLEELRALFAAPFEEHPEYEERYYRRTPQAQRQKGGISFMS